MAYDVTKATNEEGPRFNVLFPHIIVMPPLLDMVGLGPMGRKRLSENHNGLKCDSIHVDSESRLNSLLENFVFLCLS